MAFLALVMRAIGALNRLVGNVFAWLAPAIVVVCFWVVVERYVFAHTRLWMQDLYVWLNGAMFTAVAGYGLYRNDHVRVDIFFRPASLRRKAALDLLGVAVFLIPFAVVVWVYCLPFVARAWGLQEPSSNPGGMPGLFVLKGFILGFAVLLGLQGVAMAIRSVLILTGRDELVPEGFRYRYETE